MEIFFILWGTLILPVSVYGAYILWVRQKLMVWPGLAFYPQPLAGLFVFVVFSFVILGLGFFWGLPAIYRRCSTVVPAKKSTIRIFNRKNAHGEIVGWSVSIKRPGSDIWSDIRKNGLRTDDHGSIFPSKAAAIEAAKADIAARRS